MRQLTLKGRITVFKSLAVSQVMHLLLITKLYNNKIDLLFKIQEILFGKGKRQKLSTILFEMAVEREV